MLFSKCFTMMMIFTFLFLTSFLFIRDSYSKTISISNDDFFEYSTISIVPIQYNVDTIYSDKMLEGEERVVRDGSLGYALDSGTVIVKPVNKIIEVGKGPDYIAYGSTTGYGANCVGCSGNVACSTNYGIHNLISDGVYYNDFEYGNVRIVAADNSLYPCGTIISIDNGVMDPFIGIVLDTGGAMRSAWSNGNILIDIAFSYENSSGIYDATNMGGSVKFKVYRVGW